MAISDLTGKKPLLSLTGLIARKADYYPAYFYTHPVAPDKKVESGAIQ